MKRLLFLLLVFCLASIPAFAAAAAAGTDDAEAARQTMRDFFRAWSEGNEKWYRSLCAEEYLLVEEGEIWDYARDVSMLARRQKDYKRSDHFDFRHTFLRGDTAYVVYQLTSEIYEGGQTRHRHWLESAVLVRRDGRWQVALLHSSPIPPPAPATP